MNILGKIQRNRKIGAVEKKLAELMKRKKEIGEFSVDLYYDDLSGNFVARMSMYGKNAIIYHARRSNFSDAIDNIAEHIDDIVL